jgi:tricarballylate dehydrogenase
MSDYDMIVVGSGFAGAAATLSFLETAEREGRSGKVALIEVGKKGERAGASRWTMAYLRLTRDNRLSSDWVKRMEQDCRGKADLEYCRVFEAEVPNTVQFFEDHGVELIHHDEENVALEFDEQHFVYPNGGGKAIIDAYFSYIEKYDNVDIRPQTGRAAPHPLRQRGCPCVRRLRGQLRDAHEVRRRERRRPSADRAWYSL